VLEIQYFRVLVLGGGFVVLNAALNGFYTGRGKMYTVLAVSLVINTTNVGLNYCWIFGKLGFPAWGLVGAGWATVLAQGFGVVIMFALFFGPGNRRDFGTTAKIRLDKDLFRRLLRYGVPNGLHFCADISAFTVFLFLVGRKGPIQLATTNAIFCINHLAFVPMNGFAIATSTLVGQFLGRHRPDLAQRATGATLRMVLLYMAFVAAVFLLLPEQLLGLFKPRQGGADISGMLELGKTLLVFVALYSISDGVALVYSAALKGAGDTLFCLLLTFILIWSLMVLPVYLGITYFNGGARMSFVFVLVYICALACGFYLRYRGGKWKTMRVIEPEAITPVVVAEGPLVET
jgi:MATE family multidrug resistance protein